MRRSVRSVVVVVGVVGAVAAVGLSGRASPVPGGPAQGQRAPQPPPQNLQVLPKDTTMQQITPLMRSIAAALGVECTHCHVSLENRASDEKPNKLLARKMLRMTLAINNELLKDFGEPAPPGTQKVTCYTCHRGQLKPLTAPQIGGGH